MHSAPFQPSPKLSVIVRSHVAPIATASVEAYGAPPLRMVPSEQLRVQPISSGYEPAEQLMSMEREGADGGCGKLGGSVGGSGGEGGG